MWLTCRCWTQHRQLTRVNAGKRNAARALGTPQSGQGRSLEPLIFHAAWDARTLEVGHPEVGEATKRVEGWLPDPEIVVVKVKVLIHSMPRG